MQKDQVVYILGDGDRVRERIEALMLSSDFEALRSLSQQLSKAILQLAHELEQRMAAEVIVSAGDDLLVRAPAQAYNRKALQELAEWYRSSTGGSISFGAGFSIESAYLSLRKAKSSAEQKIFETFESRVL